LERRLVDKTVQNRDARRSRLVLRKFFRRFAFFKANAEKLGANRLEAVAIKRDAFSFRRDGEEFRLRLGRVLLGDDERRRRFGENDRRRDRRAETERAEKKKGRLDVATLTAIWACFAHKKVPCGKIGKKRFKRKLNVKRKRRCVVNILSRALIDVKEIPLHFVVFLEIFLTMRRAAVANERRDKKEKTPFSSQTFGNGVDGRWLNDAI
jgi:hypothetical protein